MALELAADNPDTVRAAVLIDSVLLPDHARLDAVPDPVADLRGPAPEVALRGYFSTFFAPSDNPERKRWILDQAVRTPPHVTSSVWEESFLSWDLNPRFQIESDLEKTSEVEVRFIAETHERTRVELEHRNLDRHGEGWQGAREAVSGKDGWPRYLVRFAALLSERD